MARVVRVARVARDEVALSNALNSENESALSPFWSPPEISWLLACDGLNENIDERQESPAEDVMRVSWQRLDGRDEAPGATPKLRLRPSPAWRRRVSETSQMTLRS